MNIRFFAAVAATAVLLAGCATTDPNDPYAQTKRNAAIGAATGGLLGAAGSTQQMGMMYTVDTGSGATKVVTDQTEIHMGDCVVVEMVNDRANIRRVNPEVCDPAAAVVVQELNQEFVEEAEECAMARAELAAAKTDAEFDRALMKIDILCNN